MGGERSMPRHLIRCGGAWRAPAGRATHSCILTNSSKIVLASLVLTGLELFLHMYYRCLCVDIHCATVTIWRSSRGWFVSSTLSGIFSSEEPEVKALNLIPRALRLIRASVAMMRAVSGCENRNMFTARVLSKP